MSTLLRVIVLVALLSFAAASSAHAQSPAATFAPTTEVSDDADDRPWGRLLIFVPVAALLGAGAVHGRRVARERGWLQS